MKIGCCVPVSKIEFAKELGYDFVELPGKEIGFFSEKEWSDKVAYIKQTKIPVIGFNAFSDENISLVGPNFNLSQNIDYLKKVANRGYQLGIQSIGIGSPKSRILPKDFPYQSAIEQFKSFLENSVDYTSKLGISILGEALHPYGCNFINHTMEMYKIIQDLDHPFLGIVWDIYHAFLAEENFSQLETCFNKVRHIHICSWDMNRNRYFITENDMELLHNLFSFLKEHNYCYSISIEATSHEFEVHGDLSIKLLSNLRKEYDL